MVGHSRAKEGGNAARENLPVEAAVFEVVVEGELEAARNLTAAVAREIIPCSTAGMEEGHCRRAGYFFACGTSNSVT